VLGESQDVDALRRENARLEAALAKVTAERDKLRHAYEQLKEQLELLRRRIFVAKAERIDASQLELEFAATKAKLEAMATVLGEAVGLSDPAAPPPTEPNTPRAKPTGRRNMFDDPQMAEERVEITDPSLEGKAKRIGWEESCRLGYRRGGPIRIVVARATYKVEEDGARTELVTATKPKELFERGLLAPSMIAHALVAKYRFALPFHRLVQMLRSEGVRIDDGTLCRYAEDCGATLGCIVEAMAKEAKEAAFCLSTDATGIAIQPARIEGQRRRQPCDKGHFFVVLADQDHVFFEYQSKHNSAAVCEMFRGFSRYLQADAHCIYDALFRGAARDHPEQDEPPREVGCWSHCRRKFWEAATAAKDAPSREALLRIRALFELEEKWAKLAPQERHEKRQLAARPLVDDFFAWAEGEFARVKGTRTLATTAFGYAVRQKEPLRRFLEDGRLRLTNNGSERALRSIAVGRHNWLFFGSDDHANAAANLFSLIASCQLHGLDAEAYLADIIRVLPHWPRNRYLELAPKHWARTRARLRDDELARPLGELTVPPPLASEQQATAK
jgi:transposase